MSRLFELAFVSSVFGWDFIKKSKQASITPFLVEIVFIIHTFEVSLLINYMSYCILNSLQVPPKSPTLCSRFRDIEQLERRLVLSGLSCLSQELVLMSTILPCSHPTIKQKHQ